MSVEVTKTSSNSIEIRRIFKCKRETLWEYFTEKVLREKWLCSGDISHNVGEDIEFDFDHTKYLNSTQLSNGIDLGKVFFKGDLLIFEPLEMIKFNWPSEHGHPSSVITISLTEVDGGVELYLVHELISKQNELIDASTGWHTHFDILEDVLEGSNRRDFWSRHDLLESLYSKKFS